jgi:peroxiredoxin
MLKLRFVVACMLAFGCGRSSSPGASAEAKPAPSADLGAKVAQVAKSEPTVEPLPTEELAPSKLGSPAPTFTLVDTEGKTHRLQDYKGKMVVLEWFNPDCPFVKYAHSQGELQEMAAQLTGDDLVWLSINSNAPGKQGHGVERNKTARREYSMPNPVLLDETGSIGRAYGAEKTPTMFLVDAKGVLVYRGGIDNAPMGEVDPARPRPKGMAAGDLVNYVKAALDDMEHRGAIGLPDTPAYGCSVKYGSS